VAKAQSATINFGTDLSATVQGTFTNAEWASIPVAIRTALQSSYDNSWDYFFGAIFTNSNNIKIIVEKSPEYSNFSATLGENTIYINFAITGNADALGKALENATLGRNGLGLEVGQVVPQDMQGDSHHS
jgi:protein tyrosine phosphatase